MTKKKADKPEAKAEDEIIDLNTATLEQLKALPGIGEKKAKAILDYRANTPLKSVDDLKNIKGIGEKIVDKVRARAKVEGEPVKAAPAQVAPLKASPKGSKAKSMPLLKKTEAPKADKPAPIVDKPAPIVDKPAPKGTLLAP
ncbi:helix-hairpin-helix domain-containing protein [Myxococcota bacterium]|nr:helix-hairpin-helix domain-containing protein [Myxococcota bacterium]MBU1431595.1 helix-hairpin-helix domain-containing protein [Myxococcota bacterium]MBU1900392.1 helix-hairpin-helix domain-containing protein [Myxococcota bacterium]